MARTVFTNVSIYDGNGKRPYRGEVSIQGNRIEKVARNGQNCRGGVLRRWMATARR